MIVFIKISTASVFRLQTSDHLNKGFKVTGIIADNLIKLNTILCIK